MRDGLGDDSHVRLHIKPKAMTRGALDTGKPNRYLREGAKDGLELVRLADREHKN
jgi:hypothetical protein